MDVLISIIIPVFNAEKYIAECLTSVITQTYTDLEILLIDDGSTDQSGQICDQFANEDKRIKVIHKSNGGVSSARNTGLEWAQGEYIAFVDADDCVDKEYISKLYKKIIDTKADISFCGYSKLINTNLYEVKESIPECVNVNTHDEAFVDLLCRLFTLKNYIFGSCCRILFRKTLAKDIYFNSNIKISEDLLFLVSIMLKAKIIASVSQPLYFYRQASASVSQSYKRDYLNNQEHLYLELEKIFNSLDNEICKKTFCSFICLLCYYAISNELKFKQPERKVNIQRVRESVIYKYFSLKYGLRVFSVKSKSKFIIAWLLTKTRVI